MKKPSAYSPRNAVFNRTPQPFEYEDWEVSTATLEREDPGLSIILYNDEVNTFDHVIQCLIKYCKHSAEQAEQCAWITHFKGKCEVKRGSLDELKPPCEALQDQGLSALIE